MARRIRPVIVSKESADLIERRRNVLDALNYIERGIDKLDALIVGPTERRAWESIAHAYNEFINLGSIDGCNNYIDERENDAREWDDRRANESKPSILALWQNMEKAGVNDSHALMGAAYAQFRVNQRTLYLFMERYRNDKHSGNFSFFTGEAKSKLAGTKYAAKLEALNASVEATRANVGPIKFPVNGTLDERITFIVDRTPNDQWDYPDVDMYRDANASRDTFVYVLGLYTRNDRDASQFAAMMPRHDSVASVADSLNDHINNHVNAIVEACFLDRNNPGHSGKITAIKHVREALTLGLKEAKDIVDPLWEAFVESDNE